MFTIYEYWMLHFQETNPACVELEVRMMDWLGKILGLPKQFLNETEGPGGGVIQVKNEWMIESSEN